MVILALVAQSGFLRFRPYCLMCGFGLTDFGMVYWFLVYDRFWLKSLIWFMPCLLYGLCSRNGFEWFDVLYGFWFYWFLCLAIRFNAVAG